MDFAWQALYKRHVKMMLRDRCSTSYGLASLFRGRRSSLYRHMDYGLEKSQNALARGRQLCTTFSFLRKSRRIALFLMLSTSKNEEVSQNCFVSNFKN